MVVCYIYKVESFKYALQITLPQSFQFVTIGNLIIIHIHPEKYIFGCSGVCGVNLHLDFNVKYVYTLELNQWVVFEIIIIYLSHCGVTIKTNICLKELLINYKSDQL